MNPGPTQSALSLADELENKFFPYLQSAPEYTVHLLSNVCKWLKQGNEPDNLILTRALVKLQQQLNREHVKKLWLLMANYSPQFLPELRKYFLRELAIAQYLSNDDIIALGGHLNWYREALITLVRKGLKAGKLKDPFEKGAFSYDLLELGGAEKNYLYLSGFLNQCEECPLNEIVALSRSNITIAKLILEDFSASQWFIPVGIAVVKLHPLLMRQVADKFQAYLETFPLTPAQKILWERQLNLLKEQFPHEFDRVRLDVRIQRNYQGAGPKFNFLGVAAQWDYYPLLSFFVPFFNSLVARLSGSVMCSAKVGCVGALAAATVVNCPVVLPVAAYLTLNWLNRR